jgi:hypothetical protein
MSAQNPIQEPIVSKAMQDEAFLQKLLRNPKTAIERELGIRNPQDVAILVHQDTSTTLHLVLPAKVQKSKAQSEMLLSDAELEQAIGGAGGYNPQFGGWRNSGEDG